MAPVTALNIDLGVTDVRELNQQLHRADAADRNRHWRVLNPGGKHSIACGIDAPLSVAIEGAVGYYCAGMNQQASVVIAGNAGVGVAENMMSGEVRVKGSASQSAGATGNGGRLVIEGDAAARCGISMKGIDIVVGGNIGHMSAFMGQTGRLLVCGDAGEALGDSLYEARIYVKGKVASLGADCVEKPVRADHLAEIEALLGAADFDENPRAFRRYGSARALYHFNVDNASAY